MIGTPRYCPACAGRLRPARVEGRRRHRCPRCGWTFYANPVPAAVGLIVERGRVLLTRRARPPYAGTWDLPGGFLEAGETPEECLRRELREELGIGTRAARLLGFAIDRYGPGGIALLTLVYRVRPAAGPIRAADDVAEARWFPRAAVPYRAVGFPSMRRALRRLLSGRRLQPGARNRSP